MSPLQAPRQDRLPLGALTRAVLKVRDDRLRRCSWCGEWAYAKDPCTVCSEPAP